MKLIKHLFYLFVVPILIFFTIINIIKGGGK